MKAWKRIAAVLGMALGAGAVWLAASLHRTFSSAPSFFQWGGWKDYAFLVTLAVLGIDVVVVAYCFGFRCGSEPGASSNYGPTAAGDNSGIPKVPPAER